MCWEYFNSEWLGGVGTVLNLWSFSRLFGRGHERKPVSQTGTLTVPGGVHLVTRTDILSLVRKRGSIKGIQEKFTEYN